jgi:hypothetical protein
MANADVERKETEMEIWNSEKLVESKNWGRTIKFTL